MNAGLLAVGRERALAMYADWTDRIAAGEYPHQAPPRPQGVERNVVITEWDWGGPKEYFHDEIATDRRNPTLNANGAIYGVHEVSTDLHDRSRSGAQRGRRQVPMPVRDPNTPFAAPQDMASPRRTGARNRSGTARPTCTA